jgi:hypothetical protein
MNDPLQGINPPQTNGMAIAALVIGIGSMVLAIIPVIGFLSWILSPLAIILGAIALRKVVGKGLAIGGIITGVIGVLICIAWVLLFGAAINAMPEGTMAEIQQEMERAAQEANQAGNASQAGGAVDAGQADPAGQVAQPAQTTNDNSGDYQASPVDAGNEATVQGGSGGK